MKKRFVSALVLLVALSSYLYPEGFSSIDRDLEQLENLIIDTLKSTEGQLKQLEDLRKSLSESGILIESYESIINAQEKLLADLQERLNAMSETYRTQSALSGRYGRSSRFWRTFTLIAVPVAAGLGVWAGVSVSR